jgi:peptidoglycan/xylan/chitin deacetylase (PgdA/CDA1 family)
MTRDQRREEPRDGRDGTADGIPAPDGMSGTAPGGIPRGGEPAAPPEPQSPQSPAGRTSALARSTAARVAGAVVAVALVATSASVWTALTRPAHATPGPYRAGAGTPGPTATGPHAPGPQGSGHPGPGAGPGRPGGPHPSRTPGPVPGQTSKPDPALPAPLVSMDIAHASDGGPHAVNITIDDGPDPVWTPRVLKVLRRNHVKAVFCMIGPQAAAHPALVRKVVADGNRLCDHTVSHNERMASRSHAYQSSQILRAATMISTASGGMRPDYYRAPGGAFTPYSRQIAAAHGMRPLGWNVDTEDYRRPGTAAIVATAKAELRNGPTILFHDGGGDRSQTVAALGRLLPWLRLHGYSFGFPVR